MAIAELAFLLLFCISFRASSAQPMSKFVQCLTQSSSNDSISQVIFVPNNPSYSLILNSRTQNLRFQTPETPHPQVIITPKHESQIQVAILCATRHGLQMRIRSGGHDFDGASSISQVPFFLLDMTNFRSVSVDVQSKTAWIEVGAALGEVYYTIYQANNSLYFPGGSAPTVGVGGIVSGGGYGPFSRKYGLAADNVIDAQVVDANGRILDRKSMGEDFFWAIRGGNGATFNVSRTLEQNAIQLLHKWQFVAPRLPRDLSISARFATGSAFFMAFFQGDVNTLLSLMKQYFPELGVTKEDCQEIRWVDNYAYQYGISLDLTPEFVLSRVNPFLESAPYFKGKSDFIWNLFSQRNPGESSMEWTPFGGRMDEIPVSNIPFPHRAGTSFLVVNIASWNSRNATLAQRSINWSRELYRIIGKYIPNTPTNPRGAYVNYRDFDLGTNNQNGYTTVEQARVWGAHYFKSNFDRLVKVKTMVDPQNFFNFEQSIPLYR
ncbi:hypothetical protein M9H77_27550 [Catharanthus roseus]|uniref:Uncharacterized protein n=1 Tax=Catharanthus roseus TaxID=4058 RepID=A0ACC0AFI1_CATRO|nr:hypothetical protein M9H77_27550 [Catharanthus roseus]